jgi:hypothetical protein
VSRYNKYLLNLISDECVLMCQADLKKSFRSTLNERKQMSTKTSIKRIALVAVSALGFGLLSVVPASAAIALGDITAMTLTKTSGASQVDVAVKVKLGATFASVARNASGADNYPVRASITTFPSGGSAVVSTDISTDAPTAPTGVAVAAVSATHVELVNDVSGDGVVVTDDQAVITVASHAVLAGDTVTLAGFLDDDGAGANDFAQLNGSRVVEAVTATTITVTLAAVAADVAKAAAAAGTVAVPAVANSVSNSGSTLTIVRTDQAGITAGTYTNLGEFVFTPTKSGTHVITAWYDFDGNGLLTTGEVSQTLSVSVSSAAVASTDFGNSLDTTASTDNTLVGTKVSSVGVTVVETSGRVGQMVGFAPNYHVTRNAGATASNASAALSGRAANLNYSVTNPAGTAVSVVDAKTAGVASTEQYVPGSGTLTATSATASVSTTVSIKGSTVYFNPATAGTYTITVYHDADRLDSLSYGEAVATASVVIAADALPSITFTKYGTSTTDDQADQTDFGQLVKISLRNGTTPWTLAANESLILTGASTTDFLRYTEYTAAGNSWQLPAAGASTLSLTAANFNGSGDAWINVGDTTDAGGTFTVSAVVQGGTAAGASGSFSITTINTDAATASTTTDYVLAATGDVANYNADAGVSGAAVATDGTGAWKIAPGVSTSVLAEIASGTATYKYYSALVTDTLGLITGIAGAQYSIIKQTASSATGLTDDSVVTLGFTVPATTLGLASGTQVASMNIRKASNAASITINVTVETATPNSVGVNPATLTGTTYSLRAAAASANSFTATVFDQFGNTMAGQQVIAQVTDGRNQQLVGTPLVTNADGQVTYKLTDAYTGTVLNSDTLKFTTVTGSKVGTVTVNYATYNPASTVTITGGASADVAPTVTYSYINAGTSGASGTTVKMTATVKDANGATLPAGIPVTWAISGLDGKSAILVSATTGYDWSTSMTNANGEAVTYVYAWGTGTVSVTATAGAVTSATAGKINFANAAGDARVVSATVTNNIITAKVVDRYGNPVKGVSLTATRNSGVGYFSGSASSGATGETNASGTVDFVMTGGAANVTVATTTLNAGQTSSAASQVNGTAITATSIGASLSPAGVQSVTVDVTSDSPSNIAATEAANAASDAAAEAIDAANAATDAANLAAEAADAATVAAEEARDAADAATAAVEELATQVATLMAALKAQITTLANTVAKIAKKVRA